MSGEVADQPSVRPRSAGKSGRGGVLAGGRAPARAFPATARRNLQLLMSSATGDCG